MLAVSIARGDFDIGALPRSASNHHEWPSRRLMDAPSHGQASSPARSLRAADRLPFDLCLAYRAAIMVWGGGIS